MASDTTGPIGNDYTSSPSVKKVRERKGILEASIMSLLKMYEEETGCRVESVDIVRSPSISYVSGNEKYLPPIRDSYVITDVRIEVKL